MDYKYSSDIKGLPREEVKTNFLNIVWAKNFDSLYCYRAYIKLEHTPSSLFETQTAKVSIEYVSRQVDTKTKSKINEYYSVFTRFLPYIVEECNAIIYLNDSELLEKLTLNIWTKTKKGDDSILKEAPTKLRIEIGDKIVEIDFDWTLSRTPFLYLRASLLSLNNGDKLTHLIAFK